MKVKGSGDFPINQVSLSTKADEVNTIVENNTPGIMFE